jgi:hypothetical protein
MRRDPSLALLACLLAGCAGSSAERRAALPDQSRSTTVSPPPAAPAEQLASPVPTIDLTSDAAILQAVQDFATAIQETTRTYDLRPFDRVTTPTCNCRRNLVASIRHQRLTEASSDFVGSVADVRMTGRRSDAAAVVMTLSNGPFTIRRKDGATRPGPATKTTFSCDFVFRGGRWRADYVSAAP